MRKLCLADRGHCDAVVEVGGVYGRAIGVGGDERAELVLRLHRLSPTLPPSPGQVSTSQYTVADAPRRPSVLATDRRNPILAYLPRVGSYVVVEARRPPPLRSCQRESRALRRPPSPRVAAGVPELVRRRGKLPVATGTRSVAVGRRYEYVHENELMNTSRRAGVRARLR